MYQIVRTKKEKEAQYSFNSIIPLIVALMQGVGALFTELICLVLIGGQNSSMDVIMNFVALGVIADIDNIYADSSKEQAIETVKSDEEWQPKIVVPKVNFRDRKCWNKCLYLPYYFLKLIHVVAYFYFFAFM